MLCSTASAQSEDGPDTPRYAEGYEELDVWCALTLMYLFVELSRISEGTPDAHVLHRELGKWPTCWFIASKLTCPNSLDQIRLTDYLFKHDRSDEMGRVRSYTANESTFPSCV